MISHLTPLFLLAALGVGLAFTPVPAPPSLDEQAEVAIAYMKVDDPRAEGAFAAVIAQGPTHFRAHLGAGMLATAQGRTGDAEALLKRAREIKPDDSEAALALAVLYQKADRFDDAVQVYTALRAHHPRDLRLPYNLGMLELKRRNFVAARTYLGEYLAHAPKASRKRRSVEQTMRKLEARLGREPGAVDNANARRTSAPSGKQQPAKRPAGKP